MEITTNMIEQTMDQLRHNRMQATCVETREEALALVVSLLKEGDIVGVGGSVTLDEIGLIPKLREMPIHFLDRYAPNLTPEEIMGLHRALATSDVFVSSANAITLDGALYLLDATGNRASAVAFGPKQVIIVAGTNKIVKDIDEAYDRVKRIAAPLNNKRLKKNNPCVVTGVCSDCSSAERICNIDVTIRRSGPKNRIHVILVKESLGY